MVDSEGREGGREGGGNSGTLTIQELGFLEHIMLVQMTDFKFEKPKIVVYSWMIQRQTAAFPSLYLYSISPLLHTHTGGPISLVTTSR